MIAMTKALLVAIFPILSIGLLTTVGGCNHAFACSCVQPKPPAEALDESRTVFSGMVIAISSEGYAKSATFDVYEAWKGLIFTTFIALFLLFRLSFQPS